MEPKKIQEQFWDSFWAHWNSSSAWFHAPHHWRRVDSRAAARKPKKPGVSGAASSPLHFSAGSEGPVTCKRRKHRQAS